MSNHRHSPAHAFRFAYLLSIAILPHTDWIHITAVSVARTKKKKKMTERPNEPSSSDEHQMVHVLELQSIQRNQVLQRHVQSLISFILFGR